MRPHSIAHRCVGLRAGQLRLGGIADRQKMEWGRHASAGERRPMQFVTARRARGPIGHATAQVQQGTRQEGEGRVRSQCAGIAGLGLFLVAAPLQIRRRAIVVCGHIARIELEGRIVAGDGLRKSLQRPQAVAAAIVRLAQRGPSAVARS